MSSVTGLRFKLAGSELWSPVVFVFPDAYEAAKRSNCSNAASGAAEFSTAPAVREPSFMRLGSALSSSRGSDEQRYIAIVRRSQGKRKQHSNSLTVIEGVGFRAGVTQP